MGKLQLIIGEDDYLVNEVACKTIGNGEGLEVIDSLEASNAELQLRDLARARESFQTLDMFSPTRITWWKNVHFLPGGSRSSEDVKNGLESFAKMLTAAPLAEGQTFILSGPKLLKNAAFLKTMTAVAEVITFDSGKKGAAEYAARKRAIEFAKDEGFTFANGAVEDFIAIVGTDTRSILSEVGKLRDYLGASANIATSEDVSSISSAGVMDEPEVWGLTDAIGVRNAAKAMAELKRFELQKGFDIFISGVIEKFFRTLYDMKRGEADRRLAEITARMNLYAAQKNKGFLRNWSVNELRVARQRFLALREKVVSGTVAGDTLVVTELLRSLRVSKPSVVSHVRGAAMAEK